jgi:hypothetical protein
LFKVCLVSMVCLFVGLMVFVSCPVGMPTFSICVLACHVTVECGKHVMPIVPLKCSLCGV